VKESSARVPCAWDRRNSAQPGPSRRGARLILGALEDLPDRGRRHRDAGPRELAADPPVSLRLVLPGQPQHYRPHLALRCRAPGAAPARQPRPPAADDVALPAQDRAGSDDQPHRRQALCRYRPCKQRQPRPVRSRQTRMSARPLAFSHSELMAQHKDLGVLPPPLPPRQAQQRHGTGDHQEDQPHACKPKIIPRPGRRGAEQPAVNGASGQVAQVFGTHRPEDRQEKSGKTEKVVIWPA